MRFPIAAAGRLLAFACLVAALAPTAASNFTLPPLPYATNVFEPSIDNATMFIHWNRHANAFVTGLNTALATCPQLKGRTLLSLNVGTGATRACTLAELRSPLLKLSLRGGKKCPVIPDKCATQVRNSAGGLWNHGLFFLHNLAPAGTQSYAANASPQLKAAMSAAFGSEASFRSAFSSAAASVFGSGWAWVVYDTRTRKLSIITTPNQDNPLMSLPGAPRGLPILGLDVWEHAYYLKYQNMRASYISGFFNVINWRGVSAVYARAVAGSYASLDVLVAAA